MGRGIVEAGLGRTERLELEQRTTDPATTQQGEMWLRTDLAPATDQIATLRVDNGSGAWDVPVFDATATVSNVEKVLRVPVAGTVGFVPVTTASAAFPDLRFQHAGSQHQLHDSLTASAIPDSGVTRLTFDDADTSGSTATDIWGSNDGTINGATTGVTGQYAEAYSFDGTDDYVSLPDLGLNSGSSFSFSLWVNLDTATVQQRFVGRYDGSDDLLEFGINSNNNFFAFLGHVGGAQIKPEGSGLSTGSLTMATLTYDASGPAATIYVNDTQDASDTTSFTDFGSTGGPDIGRRSDGFGYTDGVIDDFRLYDKALTSTEVSNLYSTGDIRG